MAGRDGPASSHGRAVASGTLRRPTYNGDRQLAVPPRFAREGTARMLRTLGASSAARMVLSTRFEDCGLG